MVFEPQPQPRIVAALNEKTVTQARPGCLCLSCAHVLLSCLTQHPGSASAMMFGASAAAPLPG